MGFNRNSDGTAELNLPAQRAASWQLRNRGLKFPKRPLLMGIVNVTPDSFSDGGRYFDPRVAVEHSLQLVAEGADLIDVGGESTRPYSRPISAEEELRRVIPVIQAVRRTCSVPISIDTSKAEVARHAVSSGAEIINDVTGLQGDAQMLTVARETGAGICIMHMQGTPQTMQDNPSYEDVVEEIQAYLAARLASLVDAGVDRDRICVDPGIGFGKTHQHNLTLMANCWRFHELGAPLLVGHSRKGFIGKVLGDKDADRTAGTIGGALALAAQGVQIIRVHDVAAVRQALSLFDACGGIDGQPLELEA